MFPVIGLLPVSAPVCLVNGGFHGFGHSVGIEDDLAVHISGSPAKVWISEPVERKTPSLSASEWRPGKLLGYQAPRAKD